MNEEVLENVDQHILAEDVSNKINFEFRDHFLVKPLEPIKVLKDFPKASTKETAKDENGIEAVDFEEIETREVQSDYRKGVVLKLPTTFYTDEHVADTIKVGDIVVFPDTAGRKFDLLKDSRIIRYYDIIAIER